MCCENNKEHLNDKESKIPCRVLGFEQMDADKTATKRKNEATGVYPVPYVFPGF